MSLAAPIGPSLGELGSAGAGAVEPKNLLNQTSEPEATGFADVLGKMVGQVAETQNHAVGQADALARGAIDDLHGTMIAVKEAEISMKLIGTVRNKLLDAFQELWRTNV